MTEDTTSGKPNDEAPDKPEGITCVELLVIGSIAVVFLSLRFNLLVILFPFIAIPATIVHRKFRRIPNIVFGMLMVVVYGLLTFSPIDIAFRPGPSFGVKFLPILQSHGAYGHIRRAIYEGKRENIDFIVATAGCSGPRYADSAIVFFYPSRYTSKFGESVTHEEAEKYIQHTIKMMDEWEQSEKVREQNQ